MNTVTDDTERDPSAAPDEGETIPDERNDTPDEPVTETDTEAPEE